jgi:hypothetical protein
VHPFLQPQLAELHQDDRRRDADATRRRPRRAAAGRDAPAGRDVTAEVIIRRATPADGPALAALSALDAAPMPFGPALVAEVAGSPRAVLPLDGARPFGDPFRRIDELVALLELRAAQLRDDETRRAPGRGGLLAWARLAAQRRPA